MNREPRRTKRRKEKQYDAEPQSYMQRICTREYAGPVLKDISFSMEEGDYVAVMGPSGSGKTTLMNIIGCLDQATSGRYLLDGTDVNRCREREMAQIRLKKIGFVFQNFQLLPRQTALENVTLR